MSLFYEHATQKTITVVNRRQVWTKFFKMNAVIDSSAFDGSTFYVPFLSASVVEYYSLNGRKKPADRLLINSTPVTKRENET